MKMKTEKFIGMLLCVIMIFAMAGTVSASEIAIEPIDMTRRCSLRLTYDMPYEGEVFPLSGLGIEIFRVVSFDGTADIELTGAFKEYPVAISLSYDPEAWNRVAGTLSAYAVADGIEPDAHAYTDDEGVVEFDDLEIGFYLIRWDENTLGDNEFGFAPFILCLPTTYDKKEWVYDIDAKPKPGGNLEDFPGEDVPLSDMYGYTVSKQWMDLNCSENRPESIDVDIYRNGDFFTSVRLNDENYWSYSWISRELYTWTVVERNVPDGYTVSIEKENDVFVITNIADELPPDSPTTGIRYSIPYFVYVLGAAGVLMLIIGTICSVLRKRSTDI